MYGKEKYERPHEKVATLFFGLVKNHPFPNGNKRTALICSLVALERSCFDLCNTTEEELYDMATSIAADSFPIPKRLQADPDAEVRALAVWFRGRMKRQGTGDHVTNFRELRKILTAHGCEFDAPQGNSIRIRRGPLVAKTGYPRENFEVSVAEVKNIRRKLDLDSLGSSREFYDIDNSVDQFVDDYRYLLWRLADA
jgi:death-on-curing protein